MTEPDTDVADLKARRRAPAKQARKPSVLEEASRGTNFVSPIASAFQRKNSLLLDPTEKPVVAQANGSVPGALLDDVYDVAEADFSETFTPANCRTAVSVIRWHAGDLVRKDVYAAWKKLQKAATPE